ncbi:hypothetical protein KKH27_01795 [bacterium]|nr:hypothetical protein [bacterium]MBU1982920.1 hypothetical protein [bacterium]
MARSGKLLWWIVPLFAVAVIAQTRSPIHLDHANSLVVTEEGGVICRELRGDVKMTKDSLTMTCDHALHYPDSGRVVFLRNVEVRDPHRILLADKITYDELSEVIEAGGHVRVYQGDTLSVTSRRARYYQQLSQGHLFDDVRINERSRRLVLIGQIGYLDHVRQYGRVTGNPVMTEGDSTFRIVTRVTGDTVEYFGEEKRVRVAGNVTIVRDSLVATGQVLDYFTDERMAVLLGSPEAVRGENHTRGDTMKLFFDNEQLSRVEMIGQALATSPADSSFPEPLNRMEGQRMTLWITDGVITEALVEGTAIATYYIRDQDKKRGMNVTSGDRLLIFFADRQMSRIRVEGGTQGTYTPQRLTAVPANNDIKR